MERKYKKMHILFYECACCMTVDLATNQVENWMFDTSVHTNCKVRDECVLKFETEDGERYQYMGYVPDFFPGKHFGDYIELSISSKGIVQALNITDKDIDELLKQQETWK